MTTTNPLPFLLTRDLEARSAGSSGRALLAKLDLYRLDLLGASRPLEFAERLQSNQPCSRQALEELLEWTGVERDFELVALVALAPELVVVANRLGRGRPSDDTVSEVFTYATRALRWTEELVEGERVAFVLARARAGTKSERRRLARHSVPTGPLPLGFDRAEPEGETPLRDAPLDLAVARRVITRDEQRLIGLTRSGEVTLQEFAEATSSTYDSCRMRRTRAERRLRLFLSAEVAE